MQMTNVFLDNCWLKNMADIGTLNCITLKVCLYYEIINGMCDVGHKKKKMKVICFDVVFV